MRDAHKQSALHPKGESKEDLERSPVRNEVDTFAGKIHVLWDPNAQVTALGLSPIM